MVSKKKHKQPTTADRGYRVVYVSPAVHKALKKLAAEKEMNIGDIVGGMLMKVYGKK